MANINCATPPIPDFHDDIFDPYISLGARVSVRYKTQVIKMRSGAEERIGEWQDALRDFDITPALRDQADLNEVLAFYEARSGPKYGFKLLDPTDYTVTAGYIGAGNGEQTQFALSKQYATGLPGDSHITIRPIVCPDAGIQVFLDNVLQTSGYTVNTTMGIVTFTTPPGNAVVVTWTGIFYVPVRFVDTKMAVAISAYQSYDWKIRLMEIRTPISVCVTQEALVYDFTNALLPVTFSSESTFGPEFATITVDTDSGQTNRVSQFSEGLQRFRIENPVKPISIMNQLLHFFHARRGKLIGFLVQDYLAHSVTLEPFAVTDGSKIAYQLIRTFYSGSVGRVKTIHKPIEPIKVYMDGVENTTVSVDYNTGIVYIPTSTIAGIALTWTGEYNIPVRFDTDVLTMQLNGVDAMGWNSIELTEIVNGLSGDTAGDDPGSSELDWVEDWEYVLPF